MLWSNLGRRVMERQFSPKHEQVVPNRVYFCARVEWDNVEVFAVPSRYVDPRLEDDHKF